VNATGRYIPLDYNAGISFITASRVDRDTDFKVEITNSIECFTYNFGKETDGTSYYIAIVVSRQKLDYNLLNDSINNAQGITYDQKVHAALEDELVRDIDFAGGNTVRFSTGNSSRNAVAMVMEIIK
jgi:hypothetical protein